MGRLKLRNPFKKREPLECFFCKIPLDSASVFTLQFRSADGIHTNKMCEACSKTFDELADLKDEAYKNDGF